MADEGGAEPFLVLHFDVNKTVVMSDVCLEMSVENVIGEVMADTTRGFAQGDEEWVWDGQQPSVSNSAPSSPGHMSYNHWLRQKQVDSEERNRLLSQLGREGGAASGVAPKRLQLEKELSLSAEVRDQFHAIFPEGSFPTTQPWRFIVPAFFRVVMALAERGRRFAIVFRTMGVDLNTWILQAEINAFAEGRHPLYPDAGRFDGTGGRPDLRISPDEPLSHGVFYRDADDVHLVLGTFERPPPDRSLSEVGMRHYDGRGFQILSGHAAISSYLATTTTKRGAMALRDYYPWWGTAQKRASDAGKPFYVDLADRSVHTMMFDDHVGHEESHIIDVRDPSGCSLPFSKVSGVHLVRSEPLECICNPEYFLQFIDNAEATIWKSA